MFVSNLLVYVHSCPFTKSIKMPKLTQDQKAAMAKKRDAAAAANNVKQPSKKEKEKVKAAELERRMAEHR